MTEPSRNSIVVIVDGLSAAWLGPYGNTWFDTPGIDELAAESLLLEHALIESPTIAGAYDGFWNGRCLVRGGGHGRALPRALRDAGVHACLLTDEAEVAELMAADDFAQHYGWTPTPRSSAAPDAYATAAGQVFATASMLVAEMPEPFCLWVHIQGLAGVWDAPWEMRAELADEEDPDPPHWVVPPERPLEADDPDQLLGRMQAAGAQVRAIDQCLGPLADAADQRQALLTLASARGYPLGEHGSAGLGNPLLYSDVLHVPLIFRRPDRAQGGRRTQQLAQGARLGDEIRAWHGLSEPPALPAAPEPARQLAVSALGQQTAIRTACWFARLTGDETELYVKPDDRHEVNEVADRCRAEAEAMRELAEAFKSGETPELPPLLWQPPV